MALHAKTHQLEAAVGAATEERFVPERRLLGNAAAS
jgi:hypothetical protein